MRRTPVASVFGLLLVLSGCVDSSTTEMGASETQPSEATDGSTTDAPATQGSAGSQSSSGDPSSAGTEAPSPSSSSDGTTTTPTGGDSTTGPDPESGTDGPDSESGSSPEYLTPHFPLAVGLEWTYRLTRVDGGNGSACDNRGDEHVMTVSNYDTTSGIYTVTEDPFCYFAALDYRVAGEFIDVDSGAWYHQLLLPPELDATWAAGGASGATYVWDEQHPTYTVEAGTFDDCWRRKQQGYDVWQVYCRGVGMVESHYAAWGGDSRAELLGFRE